jgi:hypothetical protein
VRPVIYYANGLGRTRTRDNTFARLGDAARGCTGQQTGWPLLSEADPRTLTDMTFLKFSQATFTSFCH